MPQIFPMNWILISIMILIMIILIMNMTFFMKSFKSKKSMNFKKLNNLTFKW
uniref:ATP synthase F0 subunit 8 n=1 Tax=Haemaphysalis campanulata TaxID=1325866 RepID=A0A976MYV0_9ACAR|nr:ATP synthase F0 subunit 8 [Haemaphysalis campanulata]UNO53835.1 ATP synthase F0 subunit 8 [Haemaphysalis campanulata]